MPSENVIKETIIFTFCTGSLCFGVGFLLLLKSKLTIKIMSRIMRKWFEKNTPKEKRTKDRHEKFLKNVGLYLLGNGIVLYFIAFWYIYIILR